MKFSIKKRLLSALFLIVSLFITVSAQATVHSYSDSLTGRAMVTYSTTWNTDTEALSLSSTFNSSKGAIDRVDFLITDGGSPHLDNTEQFLYYSLDLVNNKVNIFNYFGPRTVLESHDNIINVSKDASNNISGFSLNNLDHSALNALTFPGYSYQGAGYTNTIGIWHYLYSDNKRVESYDIHSTDTEIPVPPAEIPEPGLISLLTLGLLGMLVSGRRRFF